MDFICDSTYIVFPVSRHASCKTISFLCGGETVFDFKAAIDYISPEYFAYCNLERFRGSRLSVKCEPEMNINIEKTDTIPKNKTKDPLRPTVHFTASRGWLNDPNGLVFSDGVYHMFFQHNPYGTAWGNMHWGHAISSDLMHWSELDEALYPDQSGTMFSGSGIADVNNVLGLKSGGNDTLVLFYTAAGGYSKSSENKKFTQCMAFSTDGGKTFEKYDKNPIIDHIEAENRDPKVIYCEQTKKYVMTLYLAESRYALFTSENLTDWVRTDTIEIKGDSECPDLYPLPLDGDPKNIKWIFSGASDKYLVGSFGGSRFMPDGEPETFQHGKHFYAAQTWSDVPNSRRIRIGWYRFDIPSANFNCAMTVPHRLSLCSTPGGMRLSAEPVEEIKKLYAHSEYIDKISLDRSGIYKKELPRSAYDISMSLCTKADSMPEITIFGMKISIDTRLGRINCCGESCTYTPSDRLDIRLIIDTCGIELFADNGLIYIVGGALADFNLDYMQIKAESGAVENLEINRLKTI